MMLLVLHANCKMHGTAAGGRERGEERRWPEQPSSSTDVVHACACAVLVEGEERGLSR
jgi:hypothetical protein